MSELEWFHICQRKKENEKAESFRDVGASSVHPDASPFTNDADVTMVIVYDEEDDFGEEEE